MQSEEIREKFLKFFAKRNHVIVPSVSLVPENDSSVLFTTAGMQPLVPYLLGAPHPQGRRLVNVQKCVRTQDIEEVGDKTHDTFFEMLGNWSLGDYFKKDAIEWSFAFLTDKSDGLGLDINRLYITVFEGDDDAPRDMESANIWQSLGIPTNRIYFLGKKSNWWSPGDNGPCGPDTEMFYDITKNGLGDLTKEEFILADERQDVVEIWNDVFMEYEKKAGQVIGKLKQKNVDTGAGMERLVMVMQKKSSIFETDLFIDMMAVIDKLTNSEDIKAKRIITDHVRTAVFLIADGVAPANTDRGYILRRLLRRAIFYMDKIKLPVDVLAQLVSAVIQKYETTYHNLASGEKRIEGIIKQEEDKFRSCLAMGLKEFERLLSIGAVVRAKPLTGAEAFLLFATYGFPIEMTTELAYSRGLKVDLKAFEAEMAKHKKISRGGSEHKFKGGLADSSPQTIKLHTATHLLQAALRKVLGDHVEQRGSNITPERLRFDFSHANKVTPTELQQVENLVNQNIKRGLIMTVDIQTVAEAKKLGAMGLFEDKYAALGDKVSIYSALDPVTGEVVSREICGGPHVDNTAALGSFKINKEEAVAAGIRRIKAVIQDTNP